MTEHKTETKLVEFKAEDRTLVGVNVPTGDLNPPSLVADAIAKALFSDDHWKMGAGAFSSTDHDLVRQVGRALDWHLGGHEEELVGDRLRVESKGYLSLRRGLTHTRTAQSGGC